MDLMVKNRERETAAGKTNNEILGRVANLLQTRGFVRITIPYGGRTGNRPKQRAHIWYPPSGFALTGRGPKISSFKKADKSAGYNEN
jgi:hypothetical protein